MKKINLNKGTKTMKKASKLTALILTMVLLIASVCFMASADGGCYSYDLISGDFGYVILEDNTVIIAEYLGNDTEVEIPAEIEGGKVTVIGDYAFANCENLKKVIIPNSIVGIGDSAFSGCINLKDINIPESVTSIGNWAFSSTGINSIFIPKTVVYMGINPFRGTSLQSVIVDEENPVYDSRYNCNAIIETATNTLMTDTLNIPSSVTKIGISAFEGQVAVVTVEIPEGVTCIEEFAFAGCENLENVIMPNTVTDIERYAFTGCASLKNITIPESVTNIGGYAFSSCNSLERIELPDMLIEIGEDAFPDSATLYVNEGSNTEMLLNTNGYTFEYLEEIEEPVNIFRSIIMAIINWFKEIFKIFQ